MSLDGSARILVADADPGLRRQLHKRLLGRDVVLDFVSDGRAAVQRLSEHSYAVVLIDLSLPDVAAERILAPIRAVSATERPVVLVLAPANVARSLDVDLAQIVLRKPCNIAQLVDLVRSCIETGAAPHPPFGHLLPARRGEGH
jgi:two-component system response regulator TctD